MRTTNETVVDRIAPAVRIVAAYVAHNALPHAELGNLIGKVGSAVAGLVDGVPGPVPQATRPRPATPAEVRASVRHAGLASFIDGRVYQTLKRHLAVHGLTPSSYRERYGLPADYPMVSAAYSARRSELAKEIGLGRPGGPDVVPVAREARGRRKPA